MAVEELYSIGLSYLAPIKHDTVWTFYLERLLEAARPYNSLMTKIKATLETVPAPVARTIISATFDLVSSPRDPANTSGSFNHANYYARLGHHGIAYILVVHEIIKHPQTGSSKASGLVEYRKIFLQKWTRTFLQLGLDKDLDEVERRIIRFYIMGSQLFVPKAVLQVRAVLEEVRRDGRPDCLGRPISFVEHDTGLSWYQLGLGTGRLDVLGRNEGQYSKF
jgi:hypothetical protein